MSSGPNAAGFVAGVRQTLAAPAARKPGGLAVPGAPVMVLVDGVMLEAVALALPEVLRALGGSFLRRPLPVASSMGSQGAREGGSETGGSAGSTPSEVRAAHSRAFLDPFAAR